MRIKKTAHSALLIAVYLVASTGWLRAADNFLPEKSKFTASEARVPLRDGKRLAADVYLPKSAAGALPTILVQTPYTKQASRAAFLDPNSPRKHPLAASSDYAIVITDWRGRGASAEALTPTSVPGGTEDGVDTLEWVVAQAWCDGKVGTWGPSALGRVQYMTARAHHPRHLCAVPFVMPLNLTYDIYFPGGALWEEFVNVLKRLGWDRRAELLANPVYNDTWRELERTVYVKPSEMQIPMLIYGGWYDIYTDSVIETYQAIKAGGGKRAQQHSRLVMGPWIHGGTEPAVQGELVFENAADYGGKRALEFLDYWLRGAKNEESDRPLITYYQMGVNEWRTSASWPPAGARDVAYHLAPDKSLQAAPTPAADGSFSIKADPANPVPTVGGHLLDPSLGRGPMDQSKKVETRDDVVVFSTDVLEQPLAVAGRPRVEVHVATDGPDTDFTALLSDVYPDGRSILIGEGIRRLRFREGRDQEAFAESGKVYKIEIDLPNTAITFNKGHRARLILASSSFPHWAVNPNDGGNLYDGHQGRVANNTIHLGAARDSRLILPVVEK